MSNAVESVLIVRRSVHIEAPPARVWDEFTNQKRMELWWGKVLGVPTAGSGNGQRLITYQPQFGGSIEMEVELDGKPVRYGGRIVTFEPARELTFECDWMPNRGWLKPTFLTLRLTPALGGTLVELLHHGFERTGPSGGDEHAGYESGWGMAQLHALRALVRAA